MKPEAALQQAVATYLAQVLPDDCAWTAVDAGQGKMNPIAAAQRKARGVKSGWPDIILVWRGRFHGIELKAGASVSQVQRTQFSAIHRSGGKIAVCHSVSEVAEMLAMWDVDYRFHALTPADRDRMLADRAAVKPKRTKPRAEKPDVRVVRRVEAMRARRMF